MTELFQNESANQFSVSRWGGEEFCFFLPECNIDDANLIMHRICLAVEHMKLEFEDHEFSITITIGIEENDFSSSLDQLLESADQKLYIGKSSGRNRVVA